MLVACIKWIETPRKTLIRVSIRPLWTIKNSTKVKSNRANQLYRHSTDTNRLWGLIRTVIPTNSGIIRLLRSSVSHIKAATDLTINRTLPFVVDFVRTNTKTDKIFARVRRGNGRVRPNGKWTPLNLHRVYRRSCIKRIRHKAIRPRKAKNTISPPIIGNIWLLRKS